MGNNICPADAPLVTAPLLISTPGLLSIGHTTGHLLSASASPLNQESIHIQTSAADDPSVSQSGFTITKKAPTRVSQFHVCGVNARLAYCTTSPINRLQHYS